MAYNTAYEKHQQVKVDSSALGLNPLPTVGPCHIEAEVLEPSVAANWQVYVKPVGAYAPMYVYKDRVTP